MAKSEAAGDISSLKREVAELKKQIEATASLKESVIDLSGSIKKLIAIFREAGMDNSSDDVSAKMDILIKHNEIMAKSLLTLLDLQKEHLELQKQHLPEIAKHTRMAQPIP